MNRTLFIFVMLGMLIMPQSAEALIVINEILADPASGLAGDANDDGTRSSTEDEFIELFNQASADVDLSGWSITDTTDTRHIFPAGTMLEEKEILVIFGGGVPEIDGNWQKASSGRLGLNNGEDIISLFNARGTLINQVMYGPEAGDDQSLTRLPEGFGEEFMLHKDVDPDLRFSPGYFVHPMKQTPQAAVPEPMSGMLFLMGILGLTGIRVFRARFFML